ncbi:hypothetical protein FRB96_005943 [Tulasnella sp. 330]|nr:hypothetical protein FRB96_005943 [Tulasnella sp. 330]
MELESASSKAFFSSSGAAPGAGTTGSGGSGGNGSAGAGTNATSMSKRTTVVCQELAQLNMINSIFDVLGVPFDERQRIAQARVPSTANASGTIPSSPHPLTHGESDGESASGRGGRGREISGANGAQGPGTGMFGDIDVDWEGLRERLFSGVDLGAALGGLALGGGGGPSGRDESGDAMMVPYEGGGVPGSSSGGGRRHLALPAPTLAPKARRPLSYPAPTPSSSTPKPLGEVLKPKVHTLIAFCPPPPSSFVASPSSLPLPHTPSVLLPPSAGGAAASSNVGPAAPSDSSSGAGRQSGSSSKALPPPPTGSRRSQAAAGGGGSSGQHSQIQITARDKIVVDLVTRAFGANSIAVRVGDAASDLWAKCLGWEMDADAKLGRCGISMAERGVTWVREYEAGVIDGGEPFDFGYGSDHAGKGDDDEIMEMPPPNSRSVVALASQTLPIPRAPRNLLTLVATGCEADYQDAPRPAKDLLTLHLAYQLFVAPSMANPTSTPYMGDSDTGLPGGTTTTPPPSYHVPSSSSSSKPSSPRVFSPHLQQHASSLPFASSSTPPPLITPSHILSFLPCEPFRTALWKEFEGVMILRSSALTVKTFDNRVKAMFTWAEAAMKEKEKADDSSLTSNTSSMSSSSRRSGKSGGAKRRVNGLLKHGETPASFLPASGLGSIASNNPNLPPPPTLSFYALATAAFALGAQSYAVKLAHGFPIKPKEENGEDEDDDVMGDMSSLDDPTEASSSAIGMPPPPPPLPKINSYEMPEIPLFPLPKQPPRPTVIDENASLPPNLTPHALHSLTRAALLAHSELDLPPNLDTILAYTLSWLFILLPSDSLSKRADPGFNAARSGIASGAPLVIEARVAKEVGEVVAIARGMGLNRDMDVDVETEEKERDEDGAAKRMRMGVWEREMRRRVWWELKWWDIYISDSMGYQPMIAYESGVPLPVDVNDWRFNPTSIDVHAAPPIEGGELGQNATHFVLKCQLVQLSTELERHSIIDQNTRQLSLELAQQFETKLTRWRETRLSENFSIDFRPTVSEFPPDDPTVSQACDIHNTLNCLLLKLWMPFLTGNLMASGGSLHANARNVVSIASLACATAAHHVVVASAHMLRRFRKLRPSSFGFYGFARDVFLAATVLGTVMIYTPTAMFAETARKGLDDAIAIFKDAVVSGTYDDPSVQIKQQKYEAIRALEFVRQMAVRVGDRNTSATGSKRKVDNTVETIKMRAGYQMPFVGGAVISVAGEADVNFTPGFGVRKPQSREHHQQQPASQPQQSHSARKLRADDFTTEVSYDNSATTARREPASVVGRESSQSTRAGSGRNRARRKTETESTHIIGIAPEGYMPPAASSAHPPSAPPPSVGMPDIDSPSKAAHRARSVTGSAAGSSHVSRSALSGTRPPVIGVRDRSKPQKPYVSSASRSAGSSRGPLTGLLPPPGATGVPRSREASMTGKPGGHPSSAFLDSRPPSTMQYQVPGPSPPVAPSPPNVPTNPMPPPTYYAPPSASHGGPPQQIGGYHHSRAPSLEIQSPMSYLSQSGHNPGHNPGHLPSPPYASGSHEAMMPSLEYHPPSVAHGTVQSQPLQQQQYTSTAPPTPAVSTGQQDYSMSLGMAGQQMFQTHTAGYDASNGNAGGSGFNGSSGLPMGYDPSPHSAGPTPTQDSGQGSSFTQYGLPQQQMSTQEYPSSANGMQPSYSEHQPMYGVAGHQQQQQQQSRGHVQQDQHAQLQPQQQQQFGDFQAYQQTHPQTQYSDIDTTMAPNGWEAPSSSASTTVVREGLSGANGVQHPYPQQDMNWNN